MSNIPKTRVRRTLGRDAFAAFFEPTRHRWEVTLDGQPIAEFDNHPDALTYAHRRATTAQRKHVEKLERAAHEARRAAEKGTPEKRVQTHNTPPKEGSRIWLNRDDANTPEVHLGDRVAFESFGRTAFGVVTRWDEDGITIEEESSQPVVEQIKEFAEHTGLHLSEWQIIYLNKMFQKGLL